MSTFGRVSLRRCAMVQLRTLQSGDSNLGMSSASRVCWHRMSRAIWQFSSEDVKLLVESGEAKMGYQFKVDVEVACLHTMISA